MCSEKASCKKFIKIDKNERKWSFLPIVCIEMYWKLLNFLVYMHQMLWKMKENERNLMFLHWNPIQMYWKLKKNLLNARIYAPKY